MSRTVWLCCARSVGQLGCWDFGDFHGRPGPCLKNGCDGVEHLPFHVVMMHESADIRFRRQQFGSHLFRLGVCAVISSPLSTILGTPRLRPLLELCVP